MYIPDDEALDDEADDDEDEGDEDLGLVVEHGDRFVGGAEALEEAELATHVG